MFNELYENILTEISKSEFEDLFQPASEEELESRLMDYIKSVCTENPDGTWSASGDVDLFERGLTKLPVQFKEVGGFFECSFNSLTSLEGAPQEVGGSFYCSNNLLTSLEGAPQKVGGTFDCSFNSLTSLEGAPQTVGRNFDCSHNSLTSLEGAPQTVGGFFICSHNSLTSLEGAPQTVGGTFWCSDNKKLSVEELKKTIDRPYLDRIKESTLKEGKKEDLHKQFVETNKVPEKVFHDLVKSDRTGKQKYLSWMLKQYVLNPRRHTHIKDVVELFHKLVSKGKIRGSDSDIFLYDLESLDQKISEIPEEKSKSEIKREKKSESEKIKETDRYLIVVPKNHEASCFYGSNTKWCISSRTSEYWDRYWNMGSIIYIVIDKKENKKYAVATYPDGTREVYNEKDETIPFSSLVKKLGM